MILLLLSLDWNKLRVKWQGLYPVPGRCRRQPTKWRWRTRRRRSEYSTLVCWGHGMSPPPLRDVHGGGGGRGGRPHNQSTVWEHPNVGGGRWDSNGPHRHQFNGLPTADLPPHRMAKARHDTVREEVRQLQEAGLIELSHNTWDSPISTPQKNGSMRSCVNNRQLDKRTKPDPYPMPRVDDLPNGMGQAQYISTLDLTKGYMQVLVAEDSRPKRAFVAPVRKYQFRVMRFGLVRAPVVFQWQMNTLLAGMSQFTLAYIENVVIFSTTRGKHLTHMEAAFTRFKSAGLTSSGKSATGMTWMQLSWTCSGGRKVTRSTESSRCQGIPMASEKKDVIPWISRILHGLYPCLFHHGCPTLRPNQEKHPRQGSLG